MVMVMQYSYSCDRLGGSGANHLEFVCAFSHTKQEIRDRFHSVWKHFYIKLAKSHFSNSRGESGWCSDRTSTPGVWRHCRKMTTNTKMVKNSSKVQVELQQVYLLLV